MTQENLLLTMIHMCQHDDGVVSSDSGCSQSPVSPDTNQATAVNISQTK